MEGSVTCEVQGGIACLVCFSPYPSKHLYIILNLPKILKIFHHFNSDVGGNQIDVGRDVKDLMVMIMMTMLMVALISDDGDEDVDDDGDDNNDDDVDVGDEDDNTVVLLKVNIPQTGWNKQ